MRLIASLLLLLLFSCALPKSAVKEPVKEVPAQRNFDRRELNHYFQSTGVIKYFLPDIPEWADFSTSGSCRRDRSVRHFDIAKLRSSFNLSYHDAIQFQALYNFEYERLLLEKKSEFLPFREEEDLFYKVSEKIQGGVYHFIPPKYKKVSVIWIDPYLKREQGKGDLKGILKRKEVETGHPVFLSLCLSTAQMESYLKEIGLGEQNIRLISDAFFSVYDIGDQMLPNIYLDLGLMFRPDQEVNLFLPTPVPPLEVGGVYFEKRI